MLGKTCLCQVNQLKYAGFKREIYQVNFDCQRGQNCYSFSCHDSHLGIERAMLGGSHVILDALSCELQEVG